MTNLPEYIKRESQDADAWVCHCGNMPHTDGFYPCDKDGHEVEPNLGGDWQNLYVCASCGRIIDQDTLEVVGRKQRI